AKLRDAHAYATGGAPAEEAAPELSDSAEIGDDVIEGEESAPSSQAVVEELSAHEGSSSTQALGLEEIEELSPDDIAGEPDDGIGDAVDGYPGGDRGGGHAVGRAKKQQVVLERPVEDGDADTHYDLGLAYKEMGLWEEAIKAFNKVASLH